jgi:branched-chain amino acid transport system substrate-binding protein
MAKQTILVVTACLAAAFVWAASAGWSQAADSEELERRLREAETRYSAGDYLKSQELFLGLSRSFPSEDRFSYFQFMTAKCDYHLRKYSAARKRLADFIRQFPRSRFLPACYLILGNIAYLEGATFESAQNFVYAYERAGTEKVRALVKKSLEPLLERWLSDEELGKLSRANRDTRLAPKIWLWLGKRQLESGDLPGAFETLSFYRESFPEGEDIQEVDLLLLEASASPAKKIKVGVLAPFSGDYSPYGNSLLNGVRLALSSYPIEGREVELKIRDTEGDFVRAARLCRELIEEEGVVCIVGPLRSESAASAAMEAEHGRIPLITPTASKRGLAALSDFVFQLSPTSRTKGRDLAESAAKDQGLKEFVMLVPETAEPESEVPTFREVVEGLGGSILVVEVYPLGTQDFSPHIRRIKSGLLGFSPSPQEEASFFDEIPVWTDGLFIWANQRDLYDILSRIANLNLFGTIIGTDVCGDEQVLEFARNIDRRMIFVSSAFQQERTPERRHFSELYSDRYGKDPDFVSALSYDCMMLLLPILSRTTSPPAIRNALARIQEHAGISGRIRFDSDGENVVAPVYKLEKGRVERLR